MKKIYLAGPDVFFRDADAHFDTLQARCAALGLLGVRPTDGGLSQGAEGAQGSGDETIEEFGQPMNLMLSRSTALFGNAEAALLHLAALLSPASRGSTDHLPLR